MSKPNKLETVAGSYKEYYSTKYRQYKLAEILYLTPSKLSTLLGSNLEEVQLQRKLDGIESDVLECVYNSVLSNEFEPM